MSRLASLLCTFGADFGKDLVTTIEIVAELANKSAHDYFDV